MSEIIWLAPLCALVTVFLTRVLLAPHELYQERDQEAKAAEAELRRQMTYQEEENSGLREQLRQATRAPTNEEVTALLESSFVREVVTQLHGNAILLTSTPLPHSVRLIVTSMVYVEQIMPGMSLKGRKIFLENIPGDIKLLDVVRDYIPQRAVVVEYHRYFSATDLHEIKRGG